MSVSELIDEAYINWIEKFYAPWLFEKILWTKWQHLAREQSQ